MRCADASGEAPPEGTEEPRLRSRLSHNREAPHTSHLTPHTSHVLSRAFAFLFREAFLLSLTLALHVGVAAVAAWLVLAPRATAPKPKLIAESLELTLAETERPEPTEAAPPPSPPKAAASADPTPEFAPFLLDDASEVPLAAPDGVSPQPCRLSTPTLPSLDPNPAVVRNDPPALPHRAPASDLPEITLPPAQSLPPAGSTARLEHPRLISDSSHWLKEYPRLARQKRWQGTVVLRLDVAADGTLAGEPKLHRSSGYDILDRAALRMIRSARFEGGPGTLLQPIEYRLR